MDSQKPWNWTSRCSSIGISRSKEICSTSSSCRMKSSQVVCIFCGTDSSQFNLSRHISCIIFLAYNTIGPNRPNGSNIFAISDSMFCFVIFPVGDATYRILSFEACHVTPSVFNERFLSNVKLVCNALAERWFMTRSSLEAHCLMVKPPFASNAINSFRTARASFMLSVPVIKSTYRFVLRILAVRGYAWPSSASWCIAWMAKERRRWYAECEWNVSTSRSLRHSIRWYRLSSSCNKICKYIFSISAVRLYLYERNLIKWVNNVS